jgi:TolB-like protein/Tfp pilus assembly protein PilF
MEQAPRQSRILKFGVFEVDLETGELRRSGIRQKLAAQPFGVLRALLERPQQLVTREELRQHIWPKNTFVDYELALKKAVSRIREVLGDSAENPRFIETLSRRGYRFIAPVNDAVADRRTTAALSATRDSIVVLPFINISVDTTNEFFADGITEEIINALAQIKELHVVARSSSFSFKGKHIDPRIVGEQLNVRTVLEGSVRRVDNRLRITVQLVNAADGYHLWSERYDRDMKDIFQIQDEIARSIAERLKVTLDRAGPEQLVKVATTNLEAYQLYLKGRTFLYKRGLAVPRALECFKQAVALDTEYAHAWAGLADSYTTLGYNGFAHPASTMSKGMEAARRAVALDPSVAEAHNALAMVCLMGSWDEVEAEQAFLRALELNSRYTQARDWYALFYLVFSKGRIAEGLVQAKLALASDPLSSYAHAVYGFICAFAEMYVEALEFSRRAVELDSESYIALHLLQSILYICHLSEQSIAAGEQALAMSGRHAWAMTVLAMTFADSGKQEHANAVYTEMLARSGHQYVPPASLAVAAAAAGREREAICHAHHALEIRDPACRVYFSGYWPVSNPLDGYPPFREMLLEAGF